MKEKLKKIEEILYQNIVNSIIQLEFHEQVTDKELVKFYGGNVNREKIIEDTIRNMNGDQQLLKFVIKNKNNILKKYANKKLTDNFARAYKFTDGGSIKSQSIDKDTGKDESGRSDSGKTKLSGSKQSTENNSRD
jgi:hypothetical protein